MVKAERCLFLGLLLVQSVISGCVGPDDNGQFAVSVPGVGDSVLYDDGTDLFLDGPHDAMGPDGQTVAGWLVIMGGGLEQDRLFLRDDMRTALKRSPACYLRHDASQECDERYAAISWLGWGQPWLWGGSLFVGREIEDKTEISLEYLESLVPRTVTYHAKVTEIPGEPRYLSLTRIKPPVERDSFYLPAAEIVFVDGNPFPISVILSTGTRIALVNRTIGMTLPEELNPSGERPTVEDAPKGEARSFIGPAETNAEYIPFILREAIAIAASQSAEVQQFVSAGEKPWLKQADYVGPGTVTLCPGPEASRLVGGNQTVDRMYQWSVVLEKNQNRRISFEIQKRVRTNPVPPEFRTEIIDVPEDAKFEVRMPEPGGWTNLDWNYDRAIVEGDFSRNDTGIHIQGPLPGMPITYLFISGPSRGTSSGCEAVTSERGYGLEREAATGLLVSIVARPDRVSQFE